MPATQIRSTPEVLQMLGRIDRLERENRLLKRAMAVLFALVGVALVVHHVILRDHMSRTRPDPTVRTAPAEPGGD